ncbi:hypothetical protein OC835_004317 [Tilletia horrida]|nr:hypothetical protein OC835_004317 [Tilletia horrida]
MAAAAPPAATPTPTPTPARRDSAALLCAQLEAIFSPSLDPALVAAIAYEPGQTFDQASQILSQLLPEEGEEGDQQHNSDDHIQQQQSVSPPPSTSAASSSSAGAAAGAGQQQQLPDADSASHSSPNSSFPPTPTLSTVSASSITEAQLRDLLDHWEAEGAIIPADDDPLLNLTDEETDQKQQQQATATSPSSSPKLKTKKLKRRQSPPAKLDLYDSAADTASFNHEDDLDPTISFLAHAFPRLSPALLASTLASHKGNLTRTLDDLVTTQLLADDPGLLRSSATQLDDEDEKRQRQRQQRKEAAASASGGLDLDQLAQGTRALSLAGKKNRSARRRAADQAAVLSSGLLSPSSSSSSSSMGRTRSAGTIVRLGDVRQGGGGSSSSSNGAGNTAGSNASHHTRAESGWKDPKDRLAVAIPAHLLLDMAEASTKSGSTASLPNTPFRSTFDSANAEDHIDDDGDDAATTRELLDEERRLAIEEALAQVDASKVVTQRAAKQQQQLRTTGRTRADEPALAETSTWLLTSSILSQLVLLLRPIPFASPAAAAEASGRKVKKKRKREPNPPLFSEAEASAAHARASFVLPRTLHALIERSAEAHDSFHRARLAPSAHGTAATGGGGGVAAGESEWEAEKSIAADFELDELACTLASLGGGSAARAKMALKATGGRAEDGGDPDAALDLLQLWDAVERQFGSASGSPVGGLSAEDARALGIGGAEGEEEVVWTDVVRPPRRSAVRRFLAEEGGGAMGDEDHTGADVEDEHVYELDDEPARRTASGGRRLPLHDSPDAIDVHALPTLAQAARIASTRKAAQALSAQRRSVQTAASVLKRDPVLNMSPAAAAQHARDAIARERLAHARRGAAVVLPASAAAVGMPTMGDDGLADEGEFGGGGAGVGELSLAARRQRALDRLDYASRMETEYREKRREALRKAGTAFRGAGGAGSSYVLTSAGLKDRAEIPGSATYFGQPEPAPAPSPPSALQTRTQRSTPLLTPGPSSARSALASHGASLTPSSTKALRGSAAFYFADEARRLDAKARSWGLKAAQALVEERKLAHASSYGSRVGPGAERNVIDLHLLTTGEALAVVKEEIDKWWWSTPRGASSTSSSSSSASRPAAAPSSSASTRTQPTQLDGYGFRPLPTPYIGFGPGPLHIITGIGKHSRGNVAVLRPAVCGWLKRGGWEFEEDAPRGRIVVKGFRGTAGMGTGMGATRR